MAKTEKRTQNLKDKWYNIKIYRKKGEKNNYPVNSKMKKWALKKYKMSKIKTEQGKEIDTRKVKDRKSGKSRDR